MKKIFLAQGIVVAQDWKAADGSSVTEYVKDLVPQGDVLIVQTQDKIKVFGKDSENVLRSKCLAFETPEQLLEPELRLIKEFGNVFSLSEIQLEKISA